MMQAAEPLGREENIILSRDSVISLPAISPAHFSVPLPRNR